MQGEFRGDFTRDTHTPSKQFLRVFMQQGRVQLDADWNEQSSILLHYLQSLATDLIGPYGGPQNNCGFEMITRETLGNVDDEGKRTELDKKFDDLSSDQGPDFLIGPGHYYVYGKLCDNLDYVFYSQQANYPFNHQDQLENSQTYLAYLDVWERHITYLEDESEVLPGIREVALGKADTTTRSQLVWQVKTIAVSNENIDSTQIPPQETDASPEVVLANRRRAFVRELKQKPEKLKELFADSEIQLKPGTGKLKAQAVIPAGPDASNPCIIAPDSRYRGAENQLYRVEIHDSGVAGKATFKWSRENGSVIFPIDQAGNDITLGHLGWDDRSSLKTGDWVELVDDAYELQGIAGPLRQVDSVDASTMTVKLKEVSSSSTELKAHPLLRRWDQKGNDTNPLEKGVLLVTEGEWIELEDGIKIYFSPASEGETPSLYATGDYWLIPARTATGDVEWPRERTQDRTAEPELKPMALPPHGIEHCYAPLWLFDVDDSSVLVESNGDCRCKFPNVCQTA